jgi:hypothetical protein
MRKFLKRKIAEQYSSCLSRVQLIYNYLKFYNEIWRTLLYLISGQIEVTCSDGARFSVLGQAEMRLHFKNLVWS